MKIVFTWNFIIWKSLMLKTPSYSSYMSVYCDNVWIEIVTSPALSLHKGIVYAPAAMYYNERKN